MRVHTPHDGAYVPPPGPSGMFLPPLGLILNRRYRYVYKLLCGTMFRGAREQYNANWAALRDAFKTRGRQVLSIVVAGALQLSVSFVVSLVLYWAIYQVQHSNITP